MSFLWASATASAVNPSTPLWWSMNSGIVPISSFPRLSPNGMTLPGLHDDTNASVRQVRYCGLWNDGPATTRAAQHAARLQPDGLSALQLVGKSSDHFEKCCCQLIGVAKEEP